jgi:hypothetical protein
MLGTMNVTSDGDGPVKPRELSRSCLTIVENIGEGNFGVVSKALFEDRGNLIRGPGYLVAAKVLRSTESSARKELLEEALTMVCVSMCTVHVYVCLCVRVCM